MNDLHPFVSERVAIDFGADHLPEGVAHVRLTRGDKMNALDPAMFDAIIRAGHALFETRGLRAVVLSGEGRSFCAGLDMASMVSGGLGTSLIDRTHGNANMVQQVAMQWRRLPVPVIAAIQGVCFGGGLQIASGADMRIATADARFAIMEMKWGLIPDMGGMALWRGLVRDDVLRGLIYTNSEFSGEEALELGFATEVHADPLARALALAGEIARRNPDAIRLAKALINQLPDLDTDAILVAESIKQQQILGSANQREAVIAQMEQRAPQFSEG